MIAEYTRYLIPAEKHKEFEAAYQKAQEFLKKSPHCLGYELSRCNEEPERYMLRIEWKSMDEHLNGFRKEPNFKQFFALVQPFIKNIQEMQHYELTEIVQPSH